VNTLTAAVVVKELRRRAMTIAAAESCTAGAFTSALSTVPGASQVLWGGWVVYQTRAKSALLGVSSENIGCWGAVSEATTRALVQAARERSGASVGVAITCSAGPSAQEGSSVGDVWVAVADGASVTTRFRNIAGDRQAVQDAAVTMAIQCCGIALGLTLQ
jgi:PncC family amidohydrolase